MRSLVALLTAALALGGCVLVTGSTDGYSLADSGSASCMSSSDCPSAQVCCAGANQTSTTITGSCATSCTVSLPQLCKSSSECGDAGACALQTCSYDAAPTSITFHACGKVMGCTASP